MIMQERRRAICFGQSDLPKNATTEIRYNTPINCIWVPINPTVSGWSEQVYIGFKSTSSDTNKTVSEWSSWVDDKISELHDLGYNEDEYCGGVDIGFRTKYSPGGSSKIPTAVSGIRLSRNNGIVISTIDSTSVEKIPGTALYPWGSGYEYVYQIMNMYKVTADNYIYLCIPLDNIKLCPEVYTYDGEYDFLKNCLPIIYQYNSSGSDTKPYPVYFEYGSWS